MSLSDLNSSFKNAEARIVKRKRSKRWDSGHSRFPKPVQKKLRNLLLTYDRPSMTKLMKDLSTFCDKNQLPCPSRASIYNFAKHVPANTYDPAQLQEDIRATLYNLDDQTRIPGHQLVYYAFHYGTLRAVSQASGLPWIDLYQASFLPAWRPKSRCLLEAVLRARGIVS